MSNLNNSFIRWRETSTSVSSDEDLQESLRDCLAAGGLLSNKSVEEASKILGEILADSKSVVKAEDLKSSFISPIKPGKFFSSPGGTFDTTLLALKESQIFKGEEVAEEIRRESKVEQELSESDSESASVSAEEEMAERPIENTNEKVDNDLEQNSASWDSKVNEDYLAGVQNTKDEERGNQETEVTPHDEQSNHSLASEVREAIDDLSGFLSEIPHIGTTTGHDEGTSSETDKVTAEGGTFVLSSRVYETTCPTPAKSQGAIRKNNPNTSQRKSKIPRWMSFNSKTIKEIKTSIENAHIHLPSKEALESRLSAIFENSYNAPVAFIILKNDLNIIIDLMGKSILTLNTMKHELDSLSKEVQDIKRAIPHLSKQQTVRGGFPVSPILSHLKDKPTSRQSSTSSPNIMPQEVANQHAVADPNVSNTEASGYYALAMSVPPPKTAPPLVDEGVSNEKLGPPIVAGQPTTLGGKLVIKGFDRLSTDAKISVFSKRYKSLPGYSLQSLNSILFKITRPNIDIKAVLLKTLSEMHTALEVEIS